MFCLKWLLSAVMILCISSASLIAQQPAFLVVETFRTTDCPPCDAVETELTQIRQQNDVKNLPTYVLVFHADPTESGNGFTKPEFTNRLNAYAQMLQAQQVVYPLIVANGEHNIPAEMDNKLLEKARRDASKLAPAASITLEARKTGFQDIIVQYNITPDLRGNLLQVALVQKQGKSPDEAGESNYIQIVRDFKSLRFRGEVTTGNVSVKIPNGVEAANLQIIAFSQNQISGQIVAAAVTDIDG